MSANTNLHKAKDAKNDEFYVSLSTNLFSYQSDRRIEGYTSAQRNGGVF